MWYGQCYKFDVWDDPFCKLLTYRQEPYGCLIIYGLRAVYHIHVICCNLMDNQDGGAMDLGATPVGWWRSYHDAQDGDQVQEGPYHITLSMRVMLILLCILFCLDRVDSIIRWSLSINIKIIMCSSLVCTVKKVRRFETPHDDRVW